jgi:hypothetical protein
VHDDPVGQQEQRRAELQVRHKRAHCFRGTGSGQISRDSTRRSRCCWSTYISTYR